MTIPAYATIAYTVPVGKQTPAQVINTISQDVGASGYAGPVPPATLPFGAGPLQAMQWPAAINDVTALSLDGLTVRRLITFPTPPAVNGLFPYRNENALKSCLRNLYTRQLEAFCGTKVTAFEPVVFDLPTTILGASLGSWWHAGAINATPPFDAAFTPASWPSTATGGIGNGRTLVQAVGADQFVAATSDQFAGRVVARSTGAGKNMKTVAAAALAQPFSCAIIAAPTADGTFYDALAASANLFDRAAPLADYTTDGATTFGVGVVPAVGVAALFGTDADGVNSMIHIGTATGFGAAGAAGPTGITLLNDSAAGSGMAADVSDLILGVTGARFTDAQWSALYEFARGWNGIDLW